MFLITPNMLMAAAGASAFAKVSSSYNTTRVSYVNGYFVTAFQTGGSTLSIYTSTDGRSWSNAGWTIAGFLPSFSAAYYNSGLNQYIVQGGISPDAAYTYYIPSPLVSPSSVPKYSAAATSGVFALFSYVNSLWVQISNKSVLSSTDGITWTLKNADIFPAYTGPSDGGSRIAYGAGVYVSVCKAQAAYSSDLITWTQVTVGSVTLYDVIWAGTQFVAVGAGGVIYTSTNGSSWTARTSGTASNLFAIGIDSSRLIPYAVGSSSDTIIRSTDNGTTWSTNLFPTSVGGNVASVAVSSNKVLVGMDTGVAPYYYLLSDY
jgi:hypothetical protein